MKILLTITFLLLSNASFAGETKPAEEQEPIVCYNGPEPECRMVE
jgi:hypothetical protein